ncbi:GTPase domain-containing protein [Pyrobaculum sp.]|uniref:Rab family GTPase n=1 Tax=Pyrobaculum sp. TaxID=2004705 RepID=UPI003176993F
MGRKKSVILIGVGGVGKTTLIWRLIGLSLTPAATRRPGVYRLFYEDKLYEIVDVPGQAAFEIAQAVASAPTLFFDRALLVYDLTREDTLRALFDIMDALCLFKRCLSAREVWVVGNKRDLAERYGVVYDVDPASLGARRLEKISALYDPAYELARLLP